MPEGLSSRSSTACESIDCQRRATVYLTCEGDGSYPYCDDCAEVLLRSGETDLGPVDDPVVAERDRYQHALEEIMRRTHQGTHAPHAAAWNVARRALEESILDV